MRMRLRNLIAAIGILSALFAAPNAFAARSFLAAADPEVRAGERLTVTVFLDTEAEELNAVEGELVFPAELLELQSANDAGSIVSFWIERPGGIEEGTVAFSGIIPGGHVTARGLLFSATFLAKKSGRGSIAWRGFRALRNDGLGTETSSVTAGMEFRLLPPPQAPQAPASAEPGGAVAAPTMPSGEAAPEPQDSEPPEPFAPIVATNENVFEGKKFLVFGTQDKQSGIDHYEVCEKGRPCVVAESPYLLEDQTPEGEIVIRAVDNSGNMREGRVPVESPTPRSRLPEVAMLVAALLVLAWLALRKLRISGPHVSRTA